MTTSFKSSDIANKIGVTTHTIRRWVFRYPEYFSDDAKAPFRNQSVYTENDLRILMSIAELTNQGYGVQMIARKLKEGYRYEGSIDDIEAAPTEAKPIYKGKAVQTLEERLAEMSQKQEALEAAFLERITELTSELTETKYKLGVAEGKLELLQSQR